VTWRTFIFAIRDSKITNDIAWIILDCLFRSAGCKREFSEMAAKSWMRGNRNCKVSRYFPEGSINYEEAFRFFRNRPENKLWNLQQVFQSKVDTDSPIDVNTKDLDIFCWSLVNQFLDLLGFPRVNVDTPLEIASSEAGQLLNTQSTDISKDLASGQSQEVPGSMSMIGGTDISVKKEPSIRSMILPHSDDCCYHCIHWNGNRKTFGAYTTPTYGYCLKYNKDKQLSSTIACVDFEKREKQMGEW